MGQGGSRRRQRAREAREKAAVSDDDRSVLDLKVQRDQLLTHRRRLKAQLARDVEIAHQLVRENRKPQAMLALRKKKWHDKLLLDVESQASRLEELIDQVEFAQVQKDIVDALAAGVATLKRVNKEIGGADYVQKLMDEHEEAVMEQQEISDMLAGYGVAVDDSEAIAELSKLQEQFAAGAWSSATPEITASIRTSATPEVVVGIHDAAPAVQITATEVKSSEVSHEQGSSIGSHLGGVLNSDKLSRMGDNRVPSERHDVRPLQWLQQQSRRNCSSSIPQPTT